MASKQGKRAGWMTTGMQDTGTKRIFEPNTNASKSKTKTKKKEKKKRKKARFLEVQRRWRLEGRIWPEHAG